MKTAFLRGIAVFLLATISLTAQETKTVVEMELKQGIPFVKISVNNSGPFSFGIDTGTGGDAVVCPSLVQKLGLPQAGEVEVSDPSGSNLHRVPQYLIATLQISGIEFKDIKAALHEPFPGEESCDGTLGFPLFRNYLLALDYPQKHLAISSGSLSLDRGKGIISFDLDHGIPRIAIKVGNLDARAHIDSRGSHGLSLPENFADGLKFSSAPVVIGRGMTPSGEFEIKGGRLAADVQIAGYTFRQPFVEINAMPDANIGSIPLEHFKVTFDQKKNLVRFESSDQSLTIDPPKPRIRPLDAPAPVPLQR